MALFSWFKSVSSASDKARKNPLSIPNNFEPILTVEQLLLDHRQRITLIDELSGVSSDHFKTYYLAAIQNYARFVQGLPASEAHHHAYTGGLLLHTLDVCVNALKFRRTYLLSNSGGAEEIAKLKDLWTYAIFSAALAHDVAKPAVDQQVYLQAAQGQKLRWDPWQGFMDQQGIAYRVRFNPHRQYGLHEQAALLWVHKIIPSMGLSWLASDPNVFAAWLGFMGRAGESEPLVGIIKQADGLSVAQDLGANPNVAAMTPGAKPLHEKMLTSLRLLLSEGTLPLNRNGAAGWVIGEDIWLVSKRTVDAIREQMTSEGHTGIPTKNSRMFDILQEHGLLIPCRDRAIWKATIAGDGWQHEMTVIKMAVSKLWPNVDSRPETFEGQVIPGEPSPLPSETEIVKPERGEDDITTKVLPITISDSNSADIVSSEPNEQPTESAALPETTEPVENVEDIATGNPLLPSITESGDSKGDSADSIDTINIKESDKQTFNVNQGSTSTFNKEEQTENDVVSQLVAWIHQGLQEKTLKINQPMARLHTVPEGLLLLTPGIFQDYEQFSEIPWLESQKALLKKNWHRKTKGGLNVLSYTVKGKNKTRTLNGIVIEEPVHLIGSMDLPTPNPHLVLKEETS